MRNDDEVAPDTVVITPGGLTQSIDGAAILGLAFEGLARLDGLGYAAFAPDGTRLGVSPWLLMLLNRWRRPDVLKSLDSLIGPGTPTAARAAIADLRAGVRDRYAFDLPIWPQARESGDPVGWLRLTLMSARLARAPGVARGDAVVVVLAEDASVRVRTTEGLMRTAADYRSFFDQAIEGIFRTTADGHYVSANSALARIYGYGSVGELMGAVQDIANQLYIDPQRRVDFIRAMEASDSLFDFESEIRRRDGSRMWISENVRTVRDDAGRLLYYEGTVVDVTARKQAEQRLRHLALHDTLTDLPNRHLFLEKLSERLTQAHERGEWDFVVLCLDLDRLKTINDSLGHAAGDAVLVAMAARLGRRLRWPTLLARLGGGEFAMLVDGPSSDEDIAEVVTRLQRRISEAVKIEDRNLHLGASVGVAIPDARYRDAAEMLRDSDTALFEAKARGPGIVTTFEPRMHERARNRLSVENEMRLGLDRGEFRVFYQPFVSLVDEQITGFEALVRWEHPERGQVSPSRFIPIAEETGLIGELGEYVLRESCRQMHQWMRERLALGLDPLLLNVNLSPIQLRRSDIVDRIGRLLSDTGADPRWLSLEITESTIVDNPTATLTKLKAMKDWGIRFAVDDFGTGYSNLGQLHRLPLDTLKIDQSFVQGLLDRDEDAIVRAIVNLGRGLGLKLVAEGVETVRQRDGLRRLGCDVAQGFLYGRPMTPADLRPLIFGMTQTPLMPLRPN